MYCSASVCIWSSSSSSRRPAGIVIIFVITAEPGTATAASFDLAPEAFTALRMASATASTSWMTFSATASAGSGSTA